MVESKIDKNAIDFDNLGISEQEDDRYELDARGPIQIMRFRMDDKTKYNKELGGLLKFDGYDIATGNYVKYRTTSTVITQGMKEIAEKVGVKKQTDDKTKIEWSYLIKPVNIHGFTKKRTANGEYIKFKRTVEEE